jgi:hypothetical protein
MIFEVGYVGPFLGKTNSSGFLQILVALTIDKAWLLTRVFDCRFDFGFQCFDLVRFDLRCEGE